MFPFQTAATDQTIPDANRIVKMKDWQLNNQISKKQ